jgi:hypothetical protein
MKESPDWRALRPTATPQWPSSGAIISQENGRIINNFRIILIGLSQKIFDKISHFGLRVKRALDFALGLKTHNYTERNNNWGF